MWVFEIYVERFKLAGCIERHFILHYFSCFITCQIIHFRIGTYLLFVACDIDPSPIGLHTLSSHRKKPQPRPRKWTERQETRLYTAVYVGYAVLTEEVKLGYVWRTGKHAYMADIQSDIQKRMERIATIYS
ncbi:hypothetical protein P3L10_014088 [Capsicum annuum]